MKNLLHTVYMSVFPRGERSLFICDTGRALTLSGVYT